MSAIIATILLLCGQAFAPCEPSCAGDTWCLTSKAGDSVGNVCAAECKTDADCPALEGAEVQCYIIDGHYGCVAECEDGNDDACPGGMLCGSDFACVWPISE